MATAAPERRYTADELEAMPDAGRFELVDGQLVERHMSIFSSRSGARVTRALTEFVEERDLGYILDPQIGIRIHPTDPDHTRRPDIAFVPWARAPKEEAGFLRVAPELVVEVVSLGDGAEEVLAKVDEWIRQGVRMVWVVYPAAGQVQVFERGERPIMLTGSDEIDGGDVLPGFRTSITNFMPTRPRPA